MDWRARMPVLLMADGLLLWSVLRWLMYGCDGCWMMDFRWVHSIHIIYRYNIEELAQQNKLQEKYTWRKVNPGLSSHQIQVI
jgi:hypothetical protein